MAENTTPRDDEITLDLETGAVDDGSGRDPTTKATPDVVAAQADTGHRLDDVLSAEKIPGDDFGLFRRQDDGSYTIEYEIISQPDAEPGKEKDLILPPVLNGHFPFGPIVPGVALKSLLLGNDTSDTGHKIEIVVDRGHVPYIQPGDRLFIADYIGDDPQYKGRKALYRNEVTPAGLFMVQTEAEPSLDNGSQSPRSSGMQLIKKDRVSQFLDQAPPFLFVDEVEVDVEGGFLDGRYQTSSDTVQGVKEQTEFVPSSIVEEVVNQVAAVAYSYGSPGNMLTLKSSTFRHIDKVKVGERIIVYGKTTPDGNSACFDIWAGGDDAFRQVAVGEAVCDKMETDTFRRLLNFKWKRRKRDLLKE